MLMHILARTGLAAIVAVSSPQTAGVSTDAAKNEDPPSYSHVVVETNLNMDSPRLLAITVGESFESTKIKQAEAAQKAQEAARKERTYDLSSIQKYARELCAKEFGEGQWEALNYIVVKESGWNPRAQEPRTGAYGLGQALPASKMAPFGEDYLTNAETQVKWLMSYIKNRYRTPVEAVNWHKAHNWY